ncbi:MAG: LPS export ABC transporter ATP-binding protein [Puniceicoccales bacterium]|jgi:lipopolysaccharide export system ATP-binding protein|nr:LPS export ABC transporter ATP-binding protein [Puniceicoccales bacterium]
MSSAVHLIYTENLVKVYADREVVRGVNMHVKAGEIVGLLGPNGAGKTTCFYMIVGLVAATSGKVWFHGQDITQLPMYKRARLGIGYLPQEASVFRKLTVEENIRAILETLPLSKSVIKSRLQEALEELDLTKVAKQKAFTLSGGERRRLEITRALVTNPQCLLMDEPFSGVDPISVQEVQQIIRDLKSKKMGILITDHNVRETLRVVDRAYLLYDGKILCSGTRENLVNDPQSRKFYLGEQFES